MNDNGNGHHPDLNRGVPLLGKQSRQERVNVGAPVQSFVRHMGPDGTFEADGIVETMAVGPGQMARKVTAHPQRSDYLDATELIAEITAPILEAIDKLREEVRLLRNAVRKGEPPA